MQAAHILPQPSGHRPQRLDFRATPKPKKPHHRANWETLDRRAAIQIGRFGYPNTPALIADQVDGGAMGWEGCEPMQDA